MSHSHEATQAPGTYALVAEFETPEQLLRAAEAAKKAGYRKMDAYSPFPIHGLSDAIGFRANYVPWIVFLLGVVGCFVGYAMQWYTAVIDYPLNVGGRPLNSVPAFIPVTFEVTVLFASLGAFVGLLALCGFPKPYHSIFNTPGFERASQDRFFLAIESKDPGYHVEETFQFLNTLDPVRVSAVEP